MSSFREDAVEYRITSLKYTPTYLQCFNLLLRMCSYHKHLETYSGIFTNYCYHIHDYNMLHISGWFGGKEVVHRVYLVKREVVYTLL